VTPAPNLQYKQDVRGVDNLRLDFGMEGQEAIDRAQYLPSELIDAMSRFHIGLSAQATSCLMVMPVMYERSGVDP
jgi:hypothetical protein